MLLTMTTWALVVVVVVTMRYDDASDDDADCDAMHFDLDLMLDRHSFE
jgi:hypothetical protein